jgi:hypothetical protein
MFEDDPSVLEFLDHTIDRYQRHPDASQPTPAERFMRFPSHKLDDVADNGEVPEMPESHPEGERCAGELPRKEGSVLGKIVGHALGPDGRRWSNVRTQDYYVEDRFEIPVELQEEILADSKSAGGEPFRLPESFVRILAGNAYLGMLDVNPLGGVHSGGKTVKEDLNVWAQQTNQEARLTLWGTTDVSGHQDDRGQKSGQRWHHSVTLEWSGGMKLGEGRIQDLALVARGDERLHWNAGGNTSGGNDVAHLPAGRPIDFEGKVVYGVEAGIKSSQ